MAQKPGSFVHIELASADPARTRRFFEDVFAWKFEELPEMNYMTFEPATAPGGGLMTPMEGQPPGVLNYLLSMDIDADLRRIEAAGGRTLRPKTEIPGVGWWALFQEPTGITLALFQGRMERPSPERKEPPRRRPAAGAAARKAKKARGGRRARGRGRGRAR